MQKSPMDIQELEETAALAHLNIGREELAAALPAFEQMIGFFAAMQGADGDPLFAGAADTALLGQAAGAALVGSDHFRGDTGYSGGRDRGASGEGLSEKILGNAGERDGRFIVIPNVL